MIAFDWSAMMICLRWHLNSLSIYIVQFLMFRGGDWGITKVLFVTRGSVQKQSFFNEILPEDDEM